MPKDTHGDEQAAIPTVGVARDGQKLPQGYTPSARSLREALSKIKREYVDAAMGKGDSWTTKVINGQIGIMLDDIPKFLDVLDKKAVGKTKICIDAEIAHAQDLLFRKAAASRSLLFEDEE